MVLYAGVHKHMCTPTSAQKTFSDFNHGPILSQIEFLTGNNLALLVSGDQSNMQQDRCLLLHFSAQTYI